MPRPEGVVAFAGRHAGYGNCIDIDHGNGLRTRYAHMSAYRARVGDPVKAGQLIGAVGSTGRSTGPHLHFEVRLHGQPINPRPLLEVAPHVLDQIRNARPATWLTAAWPARPSPCLAPTSRSLAI